MRHIKWLVIPAGALLLTLPLGALDSWLSSAHLFPAPVGGVGLSSVAAGGLLAAAWHWPASRARAAIGLIGGATLGTIAVWALRYVIWQTFGEQTSQRLSGGTSMPLMAIQWTACAVAGLLAGATAGLRLSHPRHLLIHLGLVLSAVGVSEGIVRVLGIDTQLMNKALYYQTVELEAHTPVDDAQLLYALRPNTVHGGEGPWGVRDVRINAQGARSEAFAVERLPKTPRILFFGGSTLYGAGVGNRQTLPAQLQQRLRQQAPSTEVWNFGVCAYNTAQSARLAQLKLDELSPDLVLLLITNTGRRAFMGGPSYRDADKSAYFKDNPFLYLENFPPTQLSEGPHLSGMKYSALYRSAVAWARVYTDPDTTYADRADQLQVDALEAAAAAAGVPVIYVLSPSRGSEIGAQDLGLPAERWIDLNIAGRGGEYTEAHPPPKILAEYAQTIAAALSEH